MQARNRDSSKLAMCELGIMITNIFPSDPKTCIPIRIIFSSKYYIYIIVKITFLGELLMSKKHIIPKAHLYHLENTVLIYALQPDFSKFKII